MNRLYILLMVMVIMVGALFVGQEALAKVLTGTAGEDRLVGTDRNDRLDGRGGEDSLKGRRATDRLKGSRGADRLKGNRGNDRLWGGHGADTLNGGEGNDVLRALERADVTPGPNGEVDTVADTLDGGNGNDLFRTRDGESDKITCGAGTDVALLDPVDVITDASPANLNGSCEVVRRRAPHATATRSEDREESPRDEKLSR